jgi:hypothetical protein
MNAMLDGPATSLRARVDAATAVRSWASDASLAKYLGDHVLERADCVVWLDLPLRIAVARLWRRSRREGERPFGATSGAVRSQTMWCNSTSIPFDGARASFAIPSYSSKSSTSASATSFARQESASVEPVASACRRGSRPRPRQT